MTSKYLIENITEYIDPLKYFNSFVVGLKREVTEISDYKPATICPFHVEKDPSFHWWKEKKKFTCFGKCGWTGDLVDMHRKVRLTFFGELITKQQSLVELLEMYGLSSLLDSEEEAKSVIEEYCNNISPNRYKTAKGVFTLTEFKSLNDRILNSTGSIEQKIDDFSFLDKMTALIVSGSVINC